MKVITIRQALQAVANSPEPGTDELIALPVHELVCRALFEIANNVDTSQPRMMGRANTARQIILNRLVGRRAAGSHPATRDRSSIDFASLTGEIGT